MRVSLWCYWFSCHIQRVVADGGKQVIIDNTLLTLFHVWYEVCYHYLEIKVAE